MMKKVLLIAAAFILAISCSKSPTDPNDNNNDTGDGGLIDEDSGIKDQTTISDFLNKNQGRYYIEGADGTISVIYRIEGGKIYESETEMQGNKILSGSKLQVEIPVNLSGTSAYEKNSYIMIFNFSDSGIKVFYKLVFAKDDFSNIDGYQKIGTFSELGQYAGNYYQYDEDSSASQIIKYNLFKIDDSGNIYVEQSMASEVNCSLNGEELTLDFTDGVYKCILQANRAIASIFVNNVEQSSMYKKSDLLTPYKGTYTGEGVTLTVSEATASIDTIAGSGNIAAILNGNNLIVYKSWYESSGLKKEEHKITFNEDKTTATYTKPDGTGTVTLTKS